MSDRPSPASYVGAREPMGALLTWSKGLYPITQYSSAKGEIHGRKG
jgi:hypothetical protein